MRKRKEGKKEEEDEDEKAQVFDGEENEMKCKKFISTREFKEKTCDRESVKIETVRDKKRKRNRKKE